MVNIILYVENWEIEMGNIYDSTINGVNQKTNMFLLKQNYTFHMFLNAWVNNDYLDAKKAIVRCIFT